MPKTNVYALRKDGSDVRKCSNHLHSQTAPILPNDRTTGFLARATGEVAGAKFLVKNRMSKHADQR
jgi:hypothetical protein